MGFPIPAQNNTFHLVAQVRNLRIIQYYPLSSPLHLIHHRFPQRHLTAISQTLCSRTVVLILTTVFSAWSILAASLLARQLFCIFLLFANFSYSLPHFSLFWWFSFWIVPFFPFYWIILFSIQITPKLCSLKWQIHICSWFCSLGWVQMGDCSADLTQSHSCNCSYPGAWRELEIYGNFAHMPDSGGSLVGISLSFSLFPTQ